MPKKRRKFVDDGWAILVDGDDTSTVYINNWLNPKGKSYVDLAIRICAVSVEVFTMVLCRSVQQRKKVNTIFTASSRWEILLTIQMWKGISILLLSQVCVMKNMWIRPHFIRKKHRLCYLLKIYILLSIW